MALFAAITQAGCGDAADGARGSQSSSASSSSGDGGAAGHRPWPALTKVGSGELHAPRVVSIVAQNETLAAASAFHKFVQAEPKSAWFSTWSSAFPEVGAARPSMEIPGGPIPAGTAVDGKLGQQYIADAIKASGDPAAAADGTSIYVLFLPEGARIALANASGVHTVYGKNTDQFALIQRDPQGSTLAEMTATAAHEIAEAATDAGLGYRLPVQSGTTPWTDSVWGAWEGASAKGGGYIENGDFCEGTRFVEDGNTYQRIYTNRAAAKGGDPCEPALPVPYFNVSSEKDWYSGTPGENVAIPIVGWSTAKTNDFWVFTSVAAQRFGGQSYGVSVESPRAAPYGGHMRPVLNDGEQGKLHVTIPLAASSGSWVVVSLWTGHADAMGKAIPGEDFAHLFAVGVYVP